jgi:hypothetical protein
MVRRTTITVTGATGGPGVATANTTSNEAINGVIRAVYLQYTDSPPAGTTDVTVAGATSPALPILTVSNAATDGWFYPMWQADDAADATDITNQGAPVVVDDQIKVTIAQANNDDGVVATIVYEDGYR